MTVVTTYAFAAQDALRDALAALDEFTDVDVHVGFPPKRVVPRDVVWISGEIDGQQQQILSGQPGGKDESFDLVVHMLAVRSVEDYVDVREVVTARWDAIEAYLRTDQGQRLGGTVRGASTSSWQVEEAVSDDASRYALLTVRIACAAWVD